MDDTILSVTDEAKANEIESFFYSTSSPEITLFIKQTAKEYSSSSSKEAVEAAVHNLYQSKRIREEYLAEILQLQQKGKPEIENAILTFAANHSDNLGESVRTELTYYKNLTANLALYELEVWENECLSIFKAIYDAPPQAINDLMTLSEGVVNSYISQESYKRLETIKVPPKIFDLLKASRVYLNLDKAPSPNSQIVLLSFLSRSCQMLLESKKAGISTEAAVRVASRSTFGFRNSIRGLLNL